MRWFIASFFLGVVVTGAAFMPWGDIVARVCEGYVCTIDPMTAGFMGFFIGIAAVLAIDGYSEEK